MVLSAGRIRERELIRPAIEDVTAKGRFGPAALRTGGFSSKRGDLCCRCSFP